MQRILIPALGVVAQPLIIGPAISVAVAPAAGAVPLGSKSFVFSTTVHSNVKGPAEGTRPWPEEIRMTDEVKALVDRRWEEYGIDLGGAARDGETRHISRPLRRLLRL